jgi:8-oxo-dGTP diphosphatase
MIVSQPMPTSPKSPLKVVAAVIEQDDRVLIGQRRARDRHPLKWEFPGGKVEPDETPREALRRELREELDIDAEIGPEMSRYEFQYASGARILIIFHGVRQFSGDLKSGIFEQIRWEVPERLPDYDFLDGDRDFVRRLARREL